MPNELARDCGSHSIFHGVQDSKCGGGARGSGRGAKGGVNEAPACYVRGSCSGAVTKAGWYCGGQDRGASVNGPGHMLMVPVQGL
jgi:hypothetical protein